MNNPTFAEIFCAQHGIPPEQFACTVFERTLYRRALPFVWLVRFLKPNHFAADFDLIYGVEHLRRLRDFIPEAERFNEHPGNRGWLRRRASLRISTNRLKQLIRATLPALTTQKDAGAGTAVPFEISATSRSERMALGKV